MRTIIRYIWMAMVAVVATSCVTACVKAPEDGEVTEVSEALRLYPDYRGVVVPCNIAPLNFVSMDEEVECVSVRMSAEGEVMEETSRGRVMEMDEERWRQFVEKAKGEKVDVRVAVRKDGRWEGEKWTMEVSGDSIDAYVTYRLIEPGYEVWHSLKIEERCVENFETKTLADNSKLNMQCMNCHLHGEGGLTTMFYIRGENGGAMLYRNGQMKKVNLRNGEMAGGAVYGDIDASGRYGVFSTNVIIPALHSTDGRRLEVFDTKSDLCIADFDEEKMILSPQVADTTVFETFPAFSADGKTVYYCSAPIVGDLIDSIETVHYSILKIGFEDGKWGERADTLWSARVNGGSANFPKASPDGRWLVFSRSDYGTFPIWHRETDLWMIDLENGDSWALEEANSERSETYHTWSSNSRWIVFASKRGDGQYGRVYIAHIDEEGHASKAFVLPQKDAEQDLLNLKSYNIPDISRRGVMYDERTVERVFRESGAVTFR